MIRVQFEKESDFRFLRIVDLPALPRVGDIIQTNVERLCVVKVVWDVRRSDDVTIHVFCE
jgi:hypothetical protein